MYYYQIIETGEVVWVGNASMYSRTTNFRYINHPRSGSGYLNKFITSWTSIDQIQLISIYSIRWIQ